MNKQKVFLVLDNVWDPQVKEVMKYLTVGYASGSMVLVTSRSQDILVQHLHITECLEMPSLDEEGAVDVFSPLHWIQGAHQGQGTRHHHKILNECRFLKQNEVGSSFGEKSNYRYLPLALKVLGNQLQSINYKASVLKCGDWRNTWRHI